MAKGRLHSIEEFELKDQRVFLRLDLNVPLKNGEITDETRIQASLPTLKYCLEKGAKLVVASHLGRPEGNPEDRKKFSLEPVAKRLSELLEKEVLLADEPRGEVPKALLTTLRPNQLILLENVRFDDGETENAVELAQAWAQITDIYINDAFGSSHRAHASIVALPSLIKKRGLGFLMKKELDVLSGLLNPTERPYVLVLGGAKVSDKISLIENMIDRIDSLLIGGAMAYTFLQAKGIAVGKSKVEKDKVRFAGSLIERMEARGKAVGLPLDHGVVTEFSNVESFKFTSGQSIGAEEIAVDIGPRTVMAYQKTIANAKTVFWNGPMGVFETPQYSKGTFALAKAVSEMTGMSVVGGGDSAAAAEASGYAEKMSHISTGGGASLEFLQGDTLPGVEILKF